MVNISLDYAPRPSRRKHLKRWLIRLGIAGAAVIMILLLLGVEARHELAWMCGTCGSRKSQTDWLLGFTTAKSYQQSALERWLHDHQPIHVHDWHCVRDAGTNVFGKPMSASCGTAPSIYELSITGLLDDYVKQAPDPEIAAFARVLNSGSEQEQDAVCHAVAEKALAIEDASVRKP